MPQYQIRGQVPSKRHTVFRKPDGSLYAEELVSTEGFSDVYSLIYHAFPPTMVQSIGEPEDIAPVISIDKNMQSRSFKGFNLLPTDDYLESRKAVLVNKDVYISLASPRVSMTDYYFKNAQADEMIFVHRGTGKLHTIFGNIEFCSGDHLIIPRGTIYQMEFYTTDNRLFIIESFQPLRFPKRYLNKAGQLLEHAPFCERDIKTPQNLVTNDQKGSFLIKIKRHDSMYPYTYASHPFDAIGWDGCHYPFAISIHDFEPITGRIHQPPPVHQTFETPAFVTCAFVPRLYDYHPESIPAPYHHSNVDSDEILYYVAGEFMSRNNIEQGMITLHPIGIPHGPHPGAAERSIGKKETKELAVMVDTFNPLMLTKVALELEVKEYYKSWLY